MLKRLTFAAVIVALPALSLAQSGIPSATVCDGAEMGRAERARGIGSALVAGAGVADLAALLTIPRTPDGVSTARSHFGFMAATLPVAVAGLVIAQRAHPGETFWQSVIAKLEIGETTAADVRLCLHRPTVSSSSSTGERWTYVITRPSGLGGTLRTVRLTFRDSVLADVERTAVTQRAGTPTVTGVGDLGAARHHGLCAPPTPVVADAFPSATDTTFAAIAMARAQADADAASKNAAAAATYATCIASDSAR